MKIGLFFQEITFITEVPGSNFLLPTFFIGGKLDFQEANLLLATVNFEPCVSVVAGHHTVPAVLLLMIVFCLYFRTTDNGLTESKVAMEPTPPRKPKENRPFYAPPEDKPIAVQIINEARLSLKDIKTKRPFTPREDRRTLFGPRPVNSSTDNRPPSAFRYYNHPYYCNSSVFSFQNNPKNLNPSYKMDKIFGIVQEG